jgi:hypothetical protein
MNKSLPMAAIGLVMAFIAGFGAHFFYGRWSTPSEKLASVSFSESDALDDKRVAQSHPVTFVADRAATIAAAELPLLQARDVEKIRGLNGHQARIRGRVFRVGHSAKSNTYFLNFGPSREALTAVIFASAVESFEKLKLAPKGFEGKEIEIKGMVKDDPHYGLEVILENPAQIKIVN